MSVSSSETQANGVSRGATISANARYVAFESDASNLVSGDTNRATDVFVRDRATGTTQRVSVSYRGRQANDISRDPAISADGRFVAFSSNATNLIANPDTNNTEDVFVRDRSTHTTRRVSVSSNEVAGDQANFWPSISADGRYVSFTSSANNLVKQPTQDEWDVFVRDRQTGTTTLMSVPVTGTRANGYSLRSAISGNGRYVAFESPAFNLVPGDTSDTEDVFVRDRYTHTTRRASVSSAGAEANHFSGLAGISADGRYVLFGSEASNLVAEDTNAANDVFLRNMAAGTTRRVSLSNTGAQLDAGTGTQSASISADGRTVAFATNASNVVADDTNATFDMFVRDLDARTTERVSVTTLGAQANDGSGGSLAGLSADGRRVVFVSPATNLVPADTNGLIDVFVRRR